MGDYQLLNDTFFRRLQSLTQCSFSNRQPLQYSNKYLTNASKMRDGRLFSCLFTIVQGFHLVHMLQSLRAPTSENAYTYWAAAQLHCLQN